MGPIRTEDDGRCQPIEVIPTMKVRAIRRDGEEVEIELPMHATVKHGELLNRLTDGATEHWFDLDGYYDGWGAAGSLPRTMSLSECVEIVHPTPKPVN